MKVFGKLWKSIAGMSAAAVIATSVLIMPWESVKYKPSKDIGGVWDVCYGHTGPDIIIGKIYTHEECVALLIKDVKKHEAIVRKSLKIYVPDLTMAAFISFTFNTGAFGNTTLGRKAAAGDLKGACEQLSRWVYVNGKVINGLVNRRVVGDKYRYSERTICLMGLEPNYKPDWIEQVLGGTI